MYRLLIKCQKTLKNGHHNFPESKMTSSNACFVCHKQNLQIIHLTIICEKEPQQTLRTEQLEPGNVTMNQLSKELLINLKLCNIKLYFHHGSCSG